MGVLTCGALAWVVLPRNATIEFDQGIVAEAYGLIAGLGSAQAIVFRDSRITPLPGEELHGAEVRDLSELPQGIRMGYPPPTEVRVFPDSVRIYSRSRVGRLGKGVIILRSSVAEGRIQDQEGYGVRHRRLSDLVWSFEQTGTD